MVKQTRHIFTLQDITAVRLQCPKCEGEALYPLVKAKAPERCPFCNIEWERYTGEKRDAGFYMLYYMRELLSRKAPEVVFRFEINGDEKDAE